MTALAKPDDVSTVAAINIISPVFSVMVMALLPLGPSLTRVKGPGVHCQQAIRRRPMRP